MTTLAADMLPRVLLEPLATLALAVPLLGEPFGPFIVLGGGLVLAGVYVGQRERRV